MVHSLPEVPSLANASGLLFHMAGLLLCFLFLAGTCAAGERAVNDLTVKDSKRQDSSAVLKACASFKIPPALVVAIAKTESDCNPLCITISGREYRPANREEALRLARQAMRQKKSVDIGLMQINSWWLKELNLSCETVLEPKNNLLLALWILRQEMRRYGRTWKAVGAYHSKKPERQRAYIKRVQRNWLLARLDKDGMRKDGRHKDGMRKDGRHTGRS